MNGEAKGWTKAEIMAMDNQTRHERAEGYANAITRMTLTAGSVLDRSAGQKLPGAQAFHRFWNDLRNQLNNSIAAVRTVRNDLKLAATKYKEGDVNAGNIKMKDVGATLLLVAMTTQMARMYEDMVRGTEDDELPFPDSDITSWEGLKETAVNMQYRFSKTPVYFGERVIGSTPVARDVYYGMTRNTGRSDVKQVSNPFFSAMTDFATAGNAIKEQYYAATELSDYIDAFSNMSLVQQKAVLKSVGYVTGGWPINAGFKNYDWLKEKMEDVSFEAPFTVQQMEENLEKKIKNLEKNPEVSDENVQMMKQIKDDIFPPAPQFQVPEETSEIIKQIESGGNWAAKNPNSSAAGLYQFTEDTWRNIMLSAPDLGLTENGRISENTEQQELAMNWFTNENAQDLSTADIPITVTNLYMAHFLGSGDAVSVIKAPDSKKLIDLVGKKVMTANNFSASMSVRDFKQWAAQKVINAEDNLLAEN
jgi:hypothetical protein